MPSFVSWPLGSLHGDLDEVAANAARICRVSASTVWVDHNDSVFVDAPREVQDAPADYVVGTYGRDQGELASRIARDLAEMKRKHARR